MTHEALLHTLKQIPLPEGRGLWINCAAQAAGDVYSPLAGAFSGGPETHVHGAVETLAPEYDFVIMSATKQMAESEGLLALALQRAKGLVIVAAAKDAGGGRLAGMMEAYGVKIGELSKSRCRVVWTHEPQQARREWIDKNLTQLAARQVPIDGKNWWSVPGLFGWDKIDAGSKLLLEHLPVDLGGYIADFGCGYGYLSSDLAQRETVAQIDAYDQDARAAALAAKNANEKSGRAKVRPLWQDIRQLKAQPLYDAVVMNPPFHSGKQEDIALGETFIRKAWESLKPRGKLFFVANRHLPYEKIVKGLSILHEGNSFKIITGRHP